MGRLSKQGRQDDEALDAFPRGWVVTYLVRDCRDALVSIGEGTVTDTPLADPQDDGAWVPVKPTKPRSARRALVRASDAISVVAPRRGKPKRPRR